MACNIGANDVANAMGTSVGSKALTFKQAIMIAAVAEFIGAFFVGGHVSDTIRKGMLDPTIFEAVPYHLVYGMISALIAAALWLHIASYLGWPVSTTHSIVGGVVGFGVIAGGMDVINWGKMGQVVLSWIVSPVMGGVVAYLVFKFISTKVFSKRTPMVYAKNLLPYMVFWVFVILSNAMVYKGLKNLHLNLSFNHALVISLVVGSLAFAVTKFLVKKIPYNSSWDLQKQFYETENIFKYLQILTAFYVAFAHGSNDVANAVGPLAAVVGILKDGHVHMKVIMPTWILALGGGFIVFGLLIWGAKVMKTVGENITELTPSRGFAATFAAATVVLICSKMGLPISTTHTLVGSVIGVGMARGLPTLNLAIIKMIMISWVSTIPFTAIISMLCYKTFLMFLP
ncbi:MAG: inorganic phosphate transporter [Kordiimonadaceae bacterium]|jgi:PiT family inorganic phosphate transporter|nr:inorganic phosphate transporter [Kordiimonadaceae bacterium]